MIHFRNRWFDMLIPSQILMNDNTEILDWIFTLKVFVINDRFDTLTGLHLPITTKQYELLIRCGHLTTIPNRWKSAYLKWPVKKWIRLGKWIRPRRGRTSLPRYGKNLNKYFVVPLKRHAVALSLGCSISSTASKIIGLGLRPLEVSTWPMKGALWGLTLILFGLSFGLCAALELYCHYQGLPVQDNLHGQ